MRPRRSQTAWSSRTIVRYSRVGSYRVSRNVFRREPAHYTHESHALEGTFTVEHGRIRSGVISIPPEERRSQAPAGHEGSDVHDRQHVRVQPTPAAQAVI